MLAENNQKSSNMHYQLVFMLANWGITLILNALEMNALK